MGVSRSKRIRACFASGNVYRHVYPAVDAQRIWKTVKEDLDPLHEAVRSELEGSPERQDG